MNAPTAAILLASLLCASLPAHTQEPAKGIVPSGPLPDSWAIPAKPATATNPNPDAPVKLTLSLAPDPQPDPQPDFTEPHKTQPDLQSILITVTNNSDNEYYVGTMAGRLEGLKVFSVGAYGSETFIYPPSLFNCTCPGAIHLKARSVTRIKASVPVNPHNKYKKMQLSLTIGIPYANHPIEILSPIFAVGELK